jgi:hypothetical protein
MVGYNTVDRMLPALCRSSVDARFARVMTEH